VTNNDDQSIGRRGVLVIHPGAVGDVLLARPVLHLLRRRFPSHEIALLAGQAVGMLLRDGREIDRIFPLESTHLTELFAGSRNVHLQFSAWLATCDFAVGWLQDTEGVVADTLRILGVEHVYVKSPASPDLLSEHQAARYLEVIEGRVVGITACKPLALSSTLLERGRQVLQQFDRGRQERLVVIHPGSGSAYKCMEALRIIPVIEWLRQEGTTPMLLEGPADREPVAQVVAAMTVGLPVIRERDLSAVAALLSHADLYIGNDSGMTHLAAALSVSTIACFGPTSPRRWAPLGLRLSILTGVPCGCPTRNDVERCQVRVCLHIAAECIIEACRTQLMKQSTTPIA
jgi:ADP-heptose:LPS heptosyltransferase